MAVESGDVTAATLFGAIFGGLSGLALAVLAGFDGLHIALAYPAGGTCTVLLLLCLAPLAGDPAGETL